MITTLKTLTTYRVPTVEDVLALRTYLETYGDGTLTSFSYTTKYIKSTEEEYQLVKATMEIDNEKAPEGVITVDIPANCYGENDE